MDQDELVFGTKRVKGRGRRVSLRKAVVADAVILNYRRNRESYRLLQTYKQQFQPLLGSTRLHFQLPEWI